MNYDYQKEAEFLYEQEQELIRLRAEVASLHLIIGEPLDATITELRAEVAVQAAEIERLVVLGSGVTKERDALREQLEAATTCDCGKPFTKRCSGYCERDD